METGATCTQLRRPCARRQKSALSIVGSGTGTCCPRGQDDDEAPRLPKTRAIRCRGFRGLFVFLTFIDKLCLGLGTSKMRKLSPYAGRMHMRTCDNGNTTRSCSSSSSFNLIYKVASYCAQVFNRLLLFSVYLSQALFIVFIYDLTNLRQTRHVTVYDGARGIVYITTDAR